MFIDVTFCPILLNRRSVYAYVNAVRRPLWFMLVTQSALSGSGTAPKMPTIEPIVFYNYYSCRVRVSWPIKSIINGRSAHILLPVCYDSLLIYLRTAIAVYSTAHILRGEDFVYFC